MKNLKELEKKYLELGKEIEALKTKYPIYCLSKITGVVIKFTDTNTGECFKQSSEESFWDVGDVADGLKTHTDTELWHQLEVCPETGFFDGQLVWCWDNEYTHSRHLKFYDAENSNTFDCENYRCGFDYENYEAFEGNYPQWALEAFNTLER